MSSTYYIISGKQRVGPLSSQQIKHGIDSGKISFFDLIYNQQLGDWVMIMQHPDFGEVEDAQTSGSILIAQNGDHGDIGENNVAGFSSIDGKKEHQTKVTTTIGLVPTLESDLEEIKSTVGLVPGSVAEDSFVDKTVTNASRIVSNDEEDQAQIEDVVIANLKSKLWYLERFPQKALNFLEVLNDLKQRNYTEHSNISNSPDGPFKPIVNWVDFSTQSISDFEKMLNVEVPKDIIRRKHQRFPCGKVFIFIHQGKGFKALCPDISRSGVSFIVHSPRVWIGDSVYIKFSDKMTDGQYDAKADVVGSRKIRIAETGKIYYRHSLKFTQISESGKKIIEDLLGK